MPYATNGTLTTDAREIAISETWDTQTEWEAYQSINDVEITNGTVQLLFNVIPSHDVLWNIDEGTGTTLSDSADSEPGTINGATWVSGSKYTGGFGIDHDGTDDWTVSQNQFGVNNQQFGVGFWVNLSQINDFGRLVSASENQTTSNSVNTGWRIAFDTNNNINFIFRDGGSDTAETGYNTTLSTGTDYFIGISGDGGDGNLYVWDSTQQVTSQSFTGGSRGAGSNRYLRYMVGDGIHIGGVLDYVHARTTSVYTESEFETIWQETQR